MQNVKVTVIGDTGVGKTCLLISYTTNAFPSEYIPTVFDSYTANVMLDGRPVQLSLNEGSRHEEYDRLRPLNYAGTQIFLVCFAVNNRPSFEHIRTNWIVDINAHSAGVPYILCGTKSDLRNDLTNTDIFVSLEEADTLKTEIGASEYIEISALTQDNLKSLFDDALRLVLNDRLELVMNNNNNNNNDIAERREFKCECDCNWKEVLNQSWQVVAFMVTLSVYVLIDVWALLVAYEQYHTNDECWYELNSMWMHPQMFLFLGAFVSIAAVALGMLFKTLCGVDEEQQDVPRLCVLCFFFVWAIIGYVMTGQIGAINACHHQSIGKMTLAWSIVKNIEFCCGSLDIVVNAYKFHFMN